MADNAGRTVNDILQDKRAEILKVPLDPGSPSWDDIRHLKWEDVEEQARRRVPGFRTFRKLLTNRRFNK